MNSIIFPMNQNCSIKNIINNFVWQAPVIFVFGGGMLPNCGGFSGEIYIKLLLKFNTVIGNFKRCECNKRNLKAQILNLYAKKILNKFIQKVFLVLKFRKILLFLKKSLMNEFLVTLPSNQINYQSVSFSIFYDISSKTKNDHLKCDFVFASNKLYNIKLLNYEYEKYLKYYTGSTHLSLNVFCHHFSFFLSMFYEIFSS